MKIGVFDSGRGGQLIAARLQALLPGNDWVVVDDFNNVPYGEKDQQTIVELTEKAIMPLLEQCSIIVIACNTATTAAIETLRLRYPNTSFVGVEPMIKPAVANSQHAHITILATPYTLTSERYRALKTTYSLASTLDEPSTAGWPRIIDEGAEEEIDFAAIDQSIASGSDTIVLACTHFLALQPKLQQAFPNVTILEPSEALARQVAFLMK